MSTLAEFMILSGADNRPPMLEKHMYNSWKSRMEPWKLEVDVVFDGAFRRNIAGSSWGCGGLDEEAGGFHW
ncbi:hypothetical protein Tco_0564344 [Tanacetum coccineum]